MRLHRAEKEEKVRHILGEFVGDIYQIPPIRATVRRRLRIRTIYYINLLEMQGRDVLFRVGCQAGTYVRKLCHHIGQAVGCEAHMIELRRTRVGPLTEQESVTLYDVYDAYTGWKDDGDEKMLRRVVRPMEEVLVLIPRIFVRDSAVDAICHGARLAIPGILELETGIEVGDLVAMMTLKGEAIALGKALMTSEQILEMDRGLAVQTHRVIMEKGTYPRSWRAR